MKAKILAICFLAVYAIAVIGVVVYEFKHPKIIFADSLISIIALALILLGFLYVYVLDRLGRRKNQRHDVLWIIKGRLNKQRKGETK